MEGEGDDRRRLRRPVPRDRRVVPRLRLLLDTNVALWWHNDPARLDPIARTAIGSGDNEVRVSAARSVWEVAIKTATGRLTTPTPFVAALRSASIEELPVR
jgi:PIN domain nuclease of toxin-antitoxin system